MTEKTLKHELYKHGSYLHSLKESGSEFVNIDDEIKKNEELFQLASKKDQPIFVVGEYYVYSTVIFKVIEIENDVVWIKEYSEKDKSVHFEVGFGLNSDKAKHSKPAAAEQIKIFKVAEAIEKSGLTPEQHKQMFSDGKMNIGVWSALQTTDEKPQEVNKS